MLPVLMMVSANPMIFGAVISCDRPGVLCVGTIDDDIMNGTNLKDFMRASDGNDKMYGIDANDTINGENGGDTLFGGNGCLLNLLHFENTSGIKRTY